MKTTVFKETQYCFIVIIPTLLILLLLAVTYYFKLGTKKLDYTSFVVFSLLFMALLLLFYKMQVEVKNNLLIITFGIGLIKKEIVIDTILTASLTTKPISLFYGVGIRFSHFGTIYNTKPGTAVCFTLNNGKQINIVLNQIEVFINILKQHTK